MASEQKNEDKLPLAPGLYLVATPIGNLEDITLRAIRILRSADRIACEDTRQTQKLLNHFQIATPTVSYHQHNEASRTEELIAQLKSGARIAVVSDAGTPGISDPGAEIAAAAIAAGIPVFPIPGANAALAALIASGLLATDSESSAAFTFHGFLPAKEGQRRTALETLAQNWVPHVSILRGGNKPPETLKDAVIPSEAERVSDLRSRGTPALDFASEIGPGFSPDIHGLPITLSSRAERRASALRGVEGPASVSVRAQGAEPQPIHIFYEAPHRILATLADIEAVFGPAQPIVLARELTKLHEEFLRGAVSELRKALGDRAASGSIKGEFVLLFTPASTAQSASGETSSAQTQLSLAHEVRSLMQSEKLSEMDALKRVARARGLSKSAAYREFQRTRGK